MIEVQIAVQDINGRKKLTVNHRLILILGVLCTIWFAPQQVVCQTETFDIVHYTAPAGWKKTPQGQTVSYSTADSGAFCVIKVYTSTSSVGNSQEDFAGEWDALVAQPYKTVGQPKTNTEAAGNGWTGTAAGATVENQGVRFYVVLTVFRGYGRIASVLAQLNDKAYLPQIDAFLQSIRLNKRAAVQ